MIQPKDFTNKAPTGFSINPDGTVNVPANALPGDYIFTYTLCPIGSTTGCVYDIFVSFTIYPTVRAEPEIFYFDKFGVFINSSHNDPLDFNVISNDGYSENCALLAPNSFLPPVINSTITTISNVVYGLETDFYFILNEATGVLTCFNNIGLLPGYYSLEYSICDYQYPTVCSRTNVLIYVIDAVARTQNQIKQTEVIKNISIYPNPSNGIYTVDFGTVKTNASLKVFNVLGQEVLHEKNINDNFYTLDISEFADSFYTVKIINENAIVTKSIIKKQ